MNLVELWTMEGHIPAVQYDLSKEDTSVNFHKPDASEAYSSVYFLVIEDHHPGILMVTTRIFRRNGASACSTSAGHSSIQVWLTSHGGTNGSIVWQTPSELSARSA